MVSEDLSADLVFGPCEVGFEIEEKQELDLGFDRLVGFRFVIISIAGSFG